MRTYVTVINSLYWRSPHITLEFEYFFEIWASEEFIESLISFNNLEKIDATEIQGSWLQSYLNPKPEWFVPKEFDKYEIHIEPGNRLSTFRIFVDLETDHMFLTENQL